MIPMRLVFRADASHQSGSGHVMRVTTIAQEGIKRGFECHFVGSFNELPWVSEFIANIGFRSITEDPDKFVSDALRDVLILDSYTSPSASQYNDLSNWRMVLCVKDSFTPNYNADVYVNQSLECTLFSPRVHVLDGPDFALIRKEITKSPKGNAYDTTPRVLIVGGGSDPHGFVQAVVTMIQPLGIDLEIHTFSNGSLANIYDLKITQHPIGPELDLIANEVDLVISTASTSSIEFIARELPLLVACVVDNQADFYSQLCRLGYALPIGERNPDGSWNLDLRNLSAAIKDPKVRVDLSNRVRGVLDLRGASRVVDTIEKWISNGVRTEQ